MRGVECVLHTPTGVLVDKHGRELGLLDRKTSSVMCSRAEHPHSPFLAGASGGGGCHALEAIVLKGLRERASE